MSDTVTVFPGWLPGISATPAVLVGVPTTTLQQWLTDAQTAFQLIMISGQPQTVTYSQGDGMKSVIYSRGNAGQLQMWIQQLLQALGLGCGRRAIGVRFSR